MLGLEREPGRSAARDLGRRRDDVLDARAVAVDIAKRRAKPDPGARGLGERAPRDRRFEGVGARYPFGCLDDLATGDRAAGLCSSRTRGRARDRREQLDFMHRVPASGAREGNEERRS